MNKRNLKSTILAVAMVVVMSIGGIMAYFTDFEEVTNNFTYGDIEVELTEPNWDETEATKIVPNESFKKDPTVTNISNLGNDAYVFVEVEIPYANIITASLDGTRNAAADTELFFIHADDFNSDAWVELTGEINNKEYPFWDTTAKTVTHLFAYANTAEVCTKLGKNESATPFTAVTVCNAIESQGLENMAVQIDVRTYAIQAENLSVEVPGIHENDDVNDARAVWTIIMNQGTTVD